MRVRFHGHKLEGSSHLHLTLFHCGEMHLLLKVLRWDLYATMADGQWILAWFRDDYPAV